MLVLNTLNPNERLAFVLHDMFAVPFPEIAEIVGCTPAAARQLASRGRRRVQGSPTGDDVDAARTRTVVKAFLAASRGGDFAALLAVLDPDVVLRTDAAAVKMGAIPPVSGAEGVAESFCGKAKAARFALIDGAPGAVWTHRGTPMVVFSFTVDGDRITAIDLLADPDQLAGFDYEFIKR
jgi:RNA polymerase sigma-70 factor (ECF subfamily)